MLALVIAALMPKQLRAVQQNVGRRPWASLGWGALVFFVVGPAVLIVLVISVIGLLLVLPYLLFVALTYFVATTGAAAFLAQKVLTGFGGKENLMLAVTIGVVGTTIISQIPVAGPLLMLVLMVFGIGAAAIGAADWRRRRREAAAALAAAAAPYAAARRRGGAAVGHHPDGVHRRRTCPSAPGPATAVTVPQPALPARSRRRPPAGPRSRRRPMPPAASGRRPEATAGVRCRRQPAEGGRRDRLRAEAVRGGRKLPGRGAATSDRGR